MYKRILYILFLFVNFIICRSQLVEIKGIAQDTTKHRSFVFIEVNDTLKKFRKRAAITKNWDGYRELTQNKRYTTYADSSRRFILTALPKDSVTFSSFHYYPQRYAVKDLMKMQNIHIQLVPIPCIPYKPCTQKIPTHTYILIGKKINTKFVENPYYCNTFFLDYGSYESDYEVIQNIQGNYPAKIISFTSYDHYGWPQFSNSEYAMLFITEYCGKLFQLKYQYFDVYPTKSGKWAMPGNPYKYERLITDRKVQAKKIKFRDDVYFDISKLKKEAVANKYPSEYFKIVGNRAIPIKGTFAKDLIPVKEKVLIDNHFDIKK